MVFGITGWALLAVGVKHLLSGSRRAGWGWLAVADTLWCVGAVIRDDRTAVAGLAGSAAVMIWAWWNSGGGDGTRRRLRKWAHAFQGVRRTAPAGGSA